MPKDSRIAEPEFAKAVAELYNSGASRQEMSDEFGVAKNTITAWCRDPRVQAHAARMALERVNKIVRKLDSEMDARLQDVSNWELDELLKVRKEYLDRTLKIDLGAAATADTTNEILEAMDTDPEFAKALIELAGQTKGKPVAAKND